MVLLQSKKTKYHKHTFQRFSFRIGIGAETQNLLQSIPPKIKSVKKQNNKDLFFLKTFKDEKQGINFCKLQ